MHNKNLEVLNLDSIDDELVMFHHNNHVGGAVRVREPKIVALNGFGPLATVVRFKDP